jgi:outer membrane immunogenic protein
VGFNWQFAPSWVSGIEADFGFADKTVTRDGVFLPTGLNGIDPSNTDTLSVRTSWDASLRGRLGYLATPAVLAYATGGVAWQRYDITSACQCTSAVDSTSLTPTTITQSTTRVGWTVGGGLETMLWDHWLARAEYRYADFGRSLFNVNRSGEFLDHVFSSIDTLDVKLRTHTVTFGLAYKFN